MQKHKNKRYLNKYENDLWANVERKYNSKKRKCRKLLKALKKIRFWLYEIYFVVKINVNTFVTQLNQSIVDLSKVFVTRWLTWIRLFDFDVRHVSNKKHEAVDEFSRRFRTVSNDIDEINEVDIDDFIDVEMNCVRIASVRITTANEKVFLSKYSNKSKRIAVILIILNKFANINIK